MLCFFPNLSDDIVGGSGQLDTCRFDICLQQYNLSGVTCVNSVFSGPAASSRLRLFEVIPCHVMFFV